MAPTLTRRDLTRLLCALGVTGAAPGWLTGCAAGGPRRRADSAAGAPPFDGPVVIVGAGAAGITAGFLLAQAGVDFVVLEASDHHGGRLRKADDFVDFPLDLGGEWVHTRATVLNQLSQTDDADARTIEYQPTTAAWWTGSALVPSDRLARSWRGEQRFVSTTWFDFFDELMAPAVLPHLRTNTPVVHIETRDDGATLTTADGERIEAARVIFTAPLAVLKAGRVAFEPPLSRDKRDALEQVEMPPGIKVFLEFAEPFYPHLVFFDDGPLPSEEHLRMLYDVALDKGSAHHVLGLLAVGEPARPYVAHTSESDRLTHILDELDEIFDGAASRHYLQHRTQDWAAEPWIGGSYSMYETWRAVRPLGLPIGDVLHFAGEAYNLRDSWGFAHLASRAAYDAVDAILAG